MVIISPQLNTVKINHFILAGRPVNLLFFSLALLASSAHSQSLPKQKRLEFGLKAGIHQAGVTKVSAINNSSYSGFMAGGYLGFHSLKSIGYRSEAIFSRQGYNFQQQVTEGTVKLDYLLLPQLVTLQINRFVQFQLGAQPALLLQASVDSISALSTPSTGKARNYFRSVHFGLAGGVEIYPAKHVLIGARFNWGLNDILHKERQQSLPSFLPPDRGQHLKSYMIQLYIGFHM